MLLIRETQLREFENQAEARFESRMVERSFEYFPQQCAFLGEPRVRQVVRSGLARAITRGYRSQRAQSYYLCLMFMLGVDFESDRQLAFCGPILADRDLAAPAERIAALYDAAMTFLDGVCGDENQHLGRALVRVRAFDLGAFTAPNRARQPDAIASALATLYPEKAAVVGERGLKELATSGVELAHELGLDEPQGAMLCAGLAFMLGSGFHHDPQFPWVEEAVRAVERRLEKLHAGAMAFLQAGLAGA